ncbi:MAG: TRAP transporter large permease subunit [Chloroflexota bacterium]|nr:TRAP transporter large permease subunit [Chloroflexota bacterium]
MVQKFLTRIASSAAEGLSVASGVALIVLMLILTADATLRYLFNAPVYGASDIVRFAFVVVVFGGIGYCAFKKGHVSIDVLFTRLKPTGQAVLTSIISVIVLILLALITWQTTLRAGRSLAAQEVTAALQVPFAPFMYVVALGCAVWWLVVLVQLIASVNQVRESKSTKAMLTAVLGSVASVLLCAVLIFHWLPVRASPIVTGIAGFALLIGIFLTNMNVGFAMMLTGFMGLSFLTSFDIGITPLGQVPFTEGSSYGFAVVPLFVLMGELIFYSNIGQELFHAAYAWIGRLRGGLASATVLACTAFAAVSGSTVATAVTIGTVALPEMKRYKYNPAFAAAVTATGGIIGTMIPPSLAFMIYGLIAEESIGRLFIAGIIPGLLIAVVLISTITIMCYINPKLGPAAPPVAMRERLLSLKSIWPILVLFTLVIGGLYMGIFTATEAGGIGAFGALIVGLAMRRFNWKSFNGSLRATIITTGMVLLLLIGAAIFSQFVAISRLPTAMADFISASTLPPFMIIIAILAVWFALSIVMTDYAIMILITPIVLPTVLGLGYDPIWFGVILVLQTEIGAISPPVAINIFAIAGLDKEIPMTSIYKAVWPFIYALLVLTAILIAFPQISLWLPNLMKGA